MNTIITSFFAVLVPILVMDGIWLSIMMKYFYGPQLSHLTAAQPQILPVVLFYILYAIGVSFFVVHPALREGSSIIKIFLIGAFFGLVAYATYDLTNQATLKDWSTWVTLVDLVWGAVLTGTVSVLAVIITKYFS